MNNIFYVDNDYNNCYKIVEDKRWSSFKIVLEKATHEFNSIDIEDIDSLGFKYKVVCFSSWYANTGLPDEEDEDNEIFSCDKWSHRAPYFYFQDLGSNIENGYGIGEEIIHQTHIYELITNLFLKIVD